MPTEAVFRNAVASVTAALVPTMVFVLPIPGAVILPNISLFDVLFVFVPLFDAHVVRAIRWLVIGLLPFRVVVTFRMPLLGVLFGMLLVGMVFVGMLIVRTSVFLLMVVVPVVLLGIPVLSVPAVLCAGGDGPSEKQAEHGCSD